MFGCGPKYLSVLKFVRVYKYALRMNYTSPKQTVQNN